MGCTLKALELHLLKRLCDKHGLDYQEIDNNITYWENKAHLLDFIWKRSGPLVAEYGRAEKSAEERYMKEHALSHYILCGMDGETNSDEVGGPMVEYQFSLRDYILFLG